jgi:hypothetical protein
MRPELESALHQVQTLDATELPRLLGELEEIRAQSLHLMQRGFEFWPHECGRDTKWPRVSRRALRLRPRKFQSLLGQAELLTRRVRCAGIAHLYNTLVNQLLQHLRRNLLVSLSQLFRVLRSNMPPQPSETAEALRTNIAGKQIALFVSVCHRAAFLHRSAAQTPASWFVFLYPCSFQFCQSFFLPEDHVPGREAVSFPLHVPGRLVR